MKKFTKLVSATLAATVLCAVPVCAALPTSQQLTAIEDANTQRVYAEWADLIKKANGNPDGPQWSGHMKQVQSDLQHLYADNANKYVANLKSIIAGKQEIERSRLEAVNSLTSLAAVNPSFAQQLADAQNAYAAACADTLSVQQELAAAQATFGIQ